VLSDKCDGKSLSIPVIQIDKQLLQATKSKNIRLCDLWAVVNEMNDNRAWTFKKNDMAVWRTSAIIARSTRTRLGGLSRQVKRPIYLLHYRAASMFPEYS
jgi:hypothetical protein